ncbi:uncharacterized protein CLUP02_05947 [Colletotrichum lupini]|uniref:Uncharacterized protein n=1 Tax=Colletotrichum lupini TaxID=145971 RepID=A0A9Q8SN60_9PEZI|nr:uncharacterized protein CLUP02_05947 [Colletotrichum lupini]UQC80464.1 hypothetical protein CLUP02_05947 [Colletotrichum lupini]
MGPWQRNAWCVACLTCYVSQRRGNLEDERKRRRQQAEAKEYGAEGHLRLRGSLPPEFPERSRPEWPKGQHQAPGCNGRTSAGHRERGHLRLRETAQRGSHKHQPTIPALSHPLNPLTHPHQGGIYTRQSSSFVQYCNTCRPGPCSGWTGVGCVGNGEWCLARGCACFCSASERARTRRTLAPKEA